MVVLYPSLSKINQRFLAFLSLMFRKVILCPILLVFRKYLNFRSSLQMQKAELVPNDFTSFFHLYHTITCGSANAPAQNLSFDNLCQRCVWSLYRRTLWKMSRTRRDQRQELTTQGLTLACLELQRTGYQIQEARLVKAELTLHFDRKQWLSQKE